MTPGRRHLFDTRNSGSKSLLHFLLLQLLLAVKLPQETLKVLAILSALTFISADIMSHCFIRFPLKIPPGSFQVLKNVYAKGW